jgi:uncharacterized protein (TIGR03790 family)
MGTLAFVSRIARNAGPGQRWITAFVVVTSCLFARLVDAALAPNNVLVLYNAEDADSLAIASYYSQKRPGVRLLGLTGITTAEDVSANYYLANIRPQILPALDASTDVIVTTKGLPLRIRVEQSNPKNYTDPYGVSRSIGSWSWKRFSSLESELTRIDTISTWQQMGDQTTSLTPSPIEAVNPYYWEQTDFTHRQYGVRLTSRLDGFTVDDVRGMIDRGGNAYVDLGNVNNPFHFVIDDDANAAGSTADNMERLRDMVLQPRGLPYTYDGGDAFLKGPAVASADSSIVLGYVSHGVHGGSPLGYLSDADNGIQFELANGAVFASWESYNAQTFRPSASHSQGLVAEWIARGGTAGIGHVAEPLANSNTVAREDSLFNRLLNGRSFVEAAWGATNQLSYVNTVVGDPLMRFSTWIAGDLTLNGIVDADDLAHMQEYWLQPGGFYDGDLNGDGLIDSNDFSILQQNWLMTSSGLAGSTRTSVILDRRSGMPIIVYIPEPGSGLLLLIGCLCTAPLCRLPRR